MNTCPAAFLIYAIIFLVFCSPVLLRSTGGVEICLYLLRLLQRRWPCGLCRRLQPFFSPLNPSLSTHSCTVVSFSLVQFSSSLDIQNCGTYRPVPSAGFVWFFSCDQCCASWWRSHLSVVSILSPAPCQGTHDCNLTHYKPTIFLYYEVPHPALCVFGTGDLLYTMPQKLEPLSTPCPFLALGLGPDSTLCPRT